jgi:type I restriction enzyme S subunit
MSKSAENIPKRRFPEFRSEPEWEEKKLIDVADKKVKWSFIGGPFGSNLKASDYVQDGIRVIQLQNIGDGEFHSDYKIFTSEKKANELLSNNIYAGDIILSKMGDPVARACIIPDNEPRSVMGSDGIRLVVDEKEFNKFFIFTTINSKQFRNLAEKASTGSTRKRIGLSDLKKLPLLAPELKEQKKIADCLTSIDNLILSSSKKVEALKEHKKGLMQQLFPREGESVPKRRFSKFKVKWKKKKIGDIGKVSMCKRVLKNETSSTGDIPFYKIGTFGKKPDAYISKELYKNYKSKFSFPRKGDILISASGTIGRLVVYDGKPAYFQDSNIVWIDNDNKLVKNSFLFYCYQNIKWTTEDTTIARLYNDNLKNIDILIPPDEEQEEQTKIADGLSSIDNLISKQIQKVKALKEHKKGLMQQLFPIVR